MCKSGIDACLGGVPGEPRSERNPRRDLFSVRSDRLVYAHRGEHGGHHDPQGRIRKVATGANSNDKSL